jgi:hypothetical protein
MSTFIGIKIESQAQGHDLSGAGLDKSVVELAKTLSDAIPKKFKVVVLTDGAKMAKYQKAIAQAGITGIEVIEFAEGRDNTQDYRAFI